MSKKNGRSVDEVVELNGLIYQHCGLVLGRMTQDGCMEAS
jgi:hypothetical protein